jgi:glyoxylase-like metal-dependent hydrolase (beta-lactamase superfamily II)
MNRITRLGMVNAYLVHEDDGMTLIDTMLGGSAGKIIAGAEESGAPIVRILLTHAHADHIGSLDALKERLPEGQAPRRLPGRRDQAQPDGGPRRSGRLTRCDRSPRPHPGPRRAARPA